MQVLTTLYVRVLANFVNHSSIKSITKVQRISSYEYVTGFAKIDLIVTFSISRNSD